MPIDHEKIRALREQAGLTQQQAAERARIAGKQEWWKIETGRKQAVRLDTLERIARALGVGAKDLLK